MLDCSFPLDQGFYPTGLHLVHFKDNTELILINLDQEFTRIYTSLYLGVRAMLQTDYAVAEQKPTKNATTETALNTVNLRILQISL